MGTVVIIDYGAGNLRSVANAIAALGYEPKVTDLKAEVLSAKAVILPGVGAASDAMRNLDRLGLSQAIREYLAQDRPFFGVCLGLQILLGGTEEGGWHECLGVIPGKVKKLPPGLKVPHMGWNQVSQQQPHPVFDGITDNANFYFVHSYYAEPGDRSVVAGVTEYGLPFCSMVARGNLVATQFHPEKSGELGLKMYDNFLKRALKC
ncbi:MAG: imidazole glycerol phosphate synthase subunit HisH [Chloroflexi bacterium]|nr:imidazole glycerol phosphate synthase subunit HisH [Chloroflexota bacterium]